MTKAVAKKRKVAPPRPKTKRLQSKPYRPPHLPKYHVHDGTEPRAKAGNCLLCFKEKLAEHPGCTRHPQCVWWSTRASKCSCGFCIAVQNAVSRAIAEDWEKRGVLSTMDHDHVEACIGSYCYNCGYGPLMPQQENEHPRQLSMNRLDNTRPHDNDPAQTVPTCYQCNNGQNDSSMEEFHEMQVAAAAYAERGFKLTDEQMARPIPEFPNHRVDHGKRFFASYLLKAKRHNCKLKGVTFSASRNEVTTQFCCQRGCCSLCSKPLGNDITFDQTDAGEGYPGNFTLMHYACNAFKGIWPIGEAYDTAKRHVEFCKCRNE